MRIWRFAIIGLLLLAPWLAWAAPPVVDLPALLRGRQIADKFAEMAAFFANRLDESAGAKTFSDKTGNCRLSWFDWMLRHPAESVDAAEAFTGTAHRLAGQPAGALAGLVDLAAVKLDAPVLAPERRVPVAMGRADPTLQELARALITARAACDQAFAPLAPAEREELEALLYAQSTGKAGAPFFADKAKGRRVCDLLEKIDRVALMRAGLALARLNEPSTRRALARLAARHAAATTPVAVETPAGTILLGGAGADTYRLDELAGVCAVIDAGGDDTYLEGAVSAARPVLVLLDLAGNDTYRGVRPGIQGGAILGASLLIDAGGDDSYQAGDVAQGACLAGVGMLVDDAGNDRYLGDKRAQGSAICGVGLLLDRGGNDAFRAALLSQGVGGPLGFGLLDDLAGDDQYYAGGKYPDGYDDSPGYNGWSQGMGVGPRGTANGGIGVLLDGGGDDLYEADYFSHGGGYWFALGFARDFGGHDQRIGATRTVYDGGARTEPRFLRYGTGFGCHYASGFLFDDAGNDSYAGEHACVGFTWDIGVGALVDRTGNDQYRCDGSGVATCYNGGLALLLDGQGDDAYASGTLGIAEAKSPYHQDPRAYNFAVLLDLQGQDTYPAGFANRAETERGWAGGFIIDR